MTADMKSKIGKLVLSVISDHEPTLTGRYLGVGGRGSSKSQMYQDLYGHAPSLVILDEYGDIPAFTYEYDPDYVPTNKDGPKGRRWTQPIPDPHETKPVSSPSSDKRAKLRAKRKKRK